MTIRDVVFRDIKTTAVTQTRDVHIRDKIIKDCILLGSPLKVGTFSSRIVSCLHLELLVIMSTTFNPATLSNVTFLLSNIKIYCNVQKRLHFDFWSQDRIKFFAIFLPS
jgi:hypothetical protein